MKSVYSTNNFRDENYRLHHFIIIRFTQICVRKGKEKFPYLSTMATRTCISFSGEKQNAGAAR
jgi:hypothetical protein